MYIHLPFNITQFTKFLQKQQTLSYWYTGSIVGVGDGWRGGGCWCAWGAVGGGGMQG